MRILTELQLGTVGGKDKMVRFWGQKVKAQGYGETKCSPKGTLRILKVIGSEVAGFPAKACRSTIRRRGSSEMWCWPRFTIGWIFVALETFNLFWLVSFFSVVTLTECDGCGCTCEELAEAILSSLFLPPKLCLELMPMDAASAVFDVMSVASDSLLTRYSVIWFP